jgi:hypothetical protein
LNIGTPFSKGAGYYINDDRAAGGKVAEADVRTCTHCQAIIKLQEWKVHGAFCMECMAPICVLCGVEMKQKGYCVPFVKRIEAYTDAVIKLHQHLKIAGLDPVEQRSIILPG